MRPLPSPRDADRLVPALSRLAHAYTRAELVTQWSRYRLDTALASGSITRLLPGVYASREHCSDPRVRAEAIGLWAPRALITGALALHLYASSLPAPQRVDLLVTHGDRMACPPGIAAHQVVKPRASGLPAGVACTTPARALLDAWRFAPPAARRDVLYHALWARVCSWQQLRREADAAARVAGRRDLATVLGWFADGATSPLEVIARHEVFADARFRGFARQVPIPCAARTVVADMLHLESKVIIELDGERFHSGEEKRRADRIRDIELAAAGYLTLRLGWRDLVERPRWCREQVLAAVAARLGNSAP